ncbi:MAG: CoA transferase [Actinomycetia bacterium]|nr:CoA transferase [Actinomycetes bacterium]MCP3912009.1 CoA transferase [Actinomycetes bacterium]MCP4083513.1 CoA transferase [Actinomycetes bacterium]
MGKGPLEGIRVLDVASAVAGPWASTQLADAGADVIFIEKVDTPDVMRMSGAAAGDQTGAWVAMHRNKRAMALNLRDERARAVVHQLAVQTDIFIQNYRPGVADRLGIGYDDLSAINPDIIYVSISGVGATGPDSDQPVYDPIIQALAGMTEAQGGDHMKTVVADKTTAMTAANAALAALVARANGAGGQHVELNLLDSMLNWAWLDCYWNLAMPDAPPVPTYSDWYVPYDTSDGQIAAIWTSLQQYASAARAVGRADLVDDPRFATRALRLQNADAQRAEFTAALAKMTTTEAIESLKAHDVPCAPVLSREQVIDHPQVVHNGTIIEMENPNGGRSRTIRPPARFAKTPTEVSSHAPGWSEHTDEILAELGLDAATIESYRTGGVTR